MKLFRLSLLPKILLASSAALTVVFGFTGLIVIRNVVATTTKSLQEEAEVSFRAYESLWKARADLLASISSVVSGMSDVRAAFGTGDEATIRDTAGELWTRISREEALFLVADPRGKILASFGNASSSEWQGDLPAVRIAEQRFPQQASGFIQRNGNLYQVVLTPVYVDSANGPALLDVLVAGFRVDQRVVDNLKRATGGSEFVFVSGDQVLTSTLGKSGTQSLYQNLVAGNAQVSDGNTEYLPLRTPLRNIEGRQIGTLWILRSFTGAQQRIGALKREVFLIWLSAMAVALILTFLLARRILNPIAKLDRAATEVAKQNYSWRVRVDGNDELARLGQTFNAMCQSIEQGRDELIRHERISTIGRLSTSIVHDLRSPLAAIYGGAEMLMDSELSPEQVSRLSRNLYRASRQIQELLQELVDVSRGKSDSAEICKLRDLVSAAWSIISGQAELHGVVLALEVPEEIELWVECARMERAILNLLVNAVDAMPKGGTIRVTAIREGSSVLIGVADSGPGILPGLRDRLFQPFVSAGKKNGLGLGLALSRQTALDSGGDLWVEDRTEVGAHFRMRLPSGNKVQAG